MVVNIKVYCALKKQSRSMELEMSEDQYNRYNLGEELIQNIFPKYTKEQREFLISGLLPGEWEELFGLNPE